ncbi:MAG: hypothetical protein ACI906_005114 [Candidatus Latescibacterota bacterium]|jgi:hypothetical protein
MPDWIEEERAVEGGADAAKWRARRRYVALFVFAVFLEFAL